MQKKITFTLPAEIVGEASEGLLLGDFNGWDMENGITLKKKKDGSLQTTVTLEAGNIYQYRYLLNDGRWVNDHNANQYVYNETFHIENCVVYVPAVEETLDVAEPAAEEVKPVAKKAKAPAKPAAKKTKPAEEAAVVPATTDDLTRIEGIGKKIAEILANENILTYTDLSKATAKKLKDILKAAGSRFIVHDPTSWPKQAKLAAAGKWADLGKLQKELKAGK